MPKDKTNRGIVATGSLIVGVTEDENARATRTAYQNSTDPQDFRDLCDMLGLSIEDAAKFDLTKFRAEKAEYVRGLGDLNADVADAS